jgi:hypothetical protein
MCMQRMSHLRWITWNLNGDTQKNCALKCSIHSSVRISGNTFLLTVMRNVHQFWNFVGKLHIDLLLKYLFCCFIIYFPHIYQHLANGMYSPLNLFTRPQLQELLISRVAEVYGFGANGKQFRQNLLCFQLYILIANVLTMFSQEALINYSSSLTAP